jgi:hypothetical protein
VRGSSEGVPVEQAHLRNIGIANVITTSVAGVDSVTMVSADCAQGIANLSIQTGSEAGNVITVNGVLNVSGTTTRDVFRLRSDPLSASVIKDR